MIEILSYIPVTPRSDSDEGCLRLDTCPYTIAHSNKSPMLRLLPSILGFYFSGTSMSGAECQRLTCYYL